MRALILLVAVPSLFAQPAQTPSPAFTRDGIVPFEGNRAKLLVPGMVVELYGQHLAPEPPCGEAASPPAPYPVAVCGVRVLVGTTPAGLMFVSPGQINFKIPADAPAEGAAPLQVCVLAACSAPVTMQFSARTAFLRLRGTASVHMPVWVEVDEPAPYEVRYPCTSSPWSFAGYQFEVRRNGQPLPAPPPQLPVVSGGCWDLAAPSALPLHLLYDFDQPGVYSVRFTATRIVNGSGPAIAVCQSDWTDIEVQPYSGSQRDAWLQSMAEKLKTASPQDLVADIVPSLLAWPDDKALAVLLPLAARPAPRDGADLAGLAGQFARAALAAFSDDALRRAIPPDRLLNLCPPDGRCRKTN